jgi:NDP-mannose synthase
MKAVILAGGKGTRLAPYTTVFPKPLLPVGGIPILETILRQLCAHGFDEVILACGYLSSLIRLYFDQNPISSSLSIRYHQEHQPLGTAGALGSIAELGDDFLVMNGDLLTTLNFANLMQTHRASGAALTVAVVTRKVQVEMGVLEIDAGDRIVEYTEKPTLEFAGSAGIYAYSSKARDLIEREKYLDLPDLVRRLIASGNHVGAYRSDAFWLDMGNRDDYERADQEFNSRREAFLGGPESTASPGI